MLEDVGHNGITQICTSPIKRTTRKIRNLASAAELCATSKYEVVVLVVGYLININKVDVLYVACS